MKCFGFGLVWFFKQSLGKSSFQTFFEELFNTSNCCTVSTANVSPALRFLKKAPTCAAQNRVYLQYLFRISIARIAKASLF